ncbi:MAG: TIGR03905 family TSCPD domain-containing protein [Clostridiales bacterium]|nr:TIGR03905 family TSCPD domain-containing protein [Clostridiales bacterium]
MRYIHKTKNTCSKEISFDIEGNIVRNISFKGGCPGNAQAVSRLSEGLTVEEIEAKCGGIMCGDRKTSCADQLAMAVIKAYKEGMVQV